MTGRLKCRATEQLVDNKECEHPNGNRFAAPRYLLGLLHTTHRVCSLTHHVAPALIPSPGQFESAQKPGAIPAGAGRADSRHGHDGAGPRMPRPSCPVQCVPTFSPPASMPRHWSLCRTSWACCQYDQAMRKSKAISGNPSRIAFSKTPSLPPGPARRGFTPSPSPLGQGGGVAHCRTVFSSEQSRTT